MKDSTPKPSLEELLKSKSLSNPVPESWSVFHDRVKLRTLDSLHDSNRKISIRNSTLFLLILLLPLFILTSHTFEFLTSGDKIESNLNPILESSENPSVFLEKDLKDSYVKFVENNFFSSSGEDYEKSFAIENYKIQADTSAYSSPLSISGKTINDVLSQSLTV